MNSHRSCFEVDEISAEFRESNPFILTGYRRPNSTMRQCVRSLFTLNNNETLNFWTHFVPFLVVARELCSFCSAYDVWADDFVWPLFIYLATVCFYLITSSVAHALNSMSPVARHICFILDYLSISKYAFRLVI